MVEVTVKQSKRLTVAEYLAFEAIPSDERREFHAGKLIIREASTVEHVTVTTNLTVLLHGKLRGTRCEGFISTLKVQATPDHFVYPDHTIVCGEARFREDEERNVTLANPTAVFEVLSDTTRDCDLGKKFQYYRESPTIKEVFLIEQDKADVQGYLRQDDGSWSFLPTLGLDGVFEVRSAGIEIAMRDLYENVVLREDDDDRKAEGNR